MVWGWISWGKSCKHILSGPLGLISPVVRALTGHIEPCECEGTWGTQLQDSCPAKSRTLYVELEWSILPKRAVFPVAAFHGGARHRYVIEYVSLLTTISHTATRIRHSVHFWRAVQYVSMFTASRTCGGDYRHAAAKPPYSIAFTSRNTRHCTRKYSIASTLRSTRHCTRTTIQRCIYVKALRCIALETVQNIAQWKPLLCFALHYFPVQCIACQGTL